MTKKFFTDESLYTLVSEIKGYTEDAVSTKADSGHNHNGLYYSKAEVDTSFEELSEGFSNVIYQMYGEDLTEDGAPTIRQIANDEANSALDSAKAYTDSAVDPLSDAIDGLSTNYNESIIGLSVDGTTVTYIKGDGTSHSFETQDTNTTYSLGTDEVTGLTKLYATIGSAEDGTMTQKAIKTELDKKVGVSVDSTQNALVFTI